MPTANSVETIAYAAAAVKSLDWMHVNVCVLLFYSNLLPPCQGLPSISRHPTPIILCSKRHHLCTSHFVPCHTPRCSLCCQS